MHSKSETPVSVRWVAVALGAAIAFYIVNNSIWLMMDRSSPSYDKAVHATVALKYRQLFEEPARLSLTKLLQVSKYYPPLFHASSALFTIPLGFSTSAVAATNFLFLPALVLGIYGTGKRLFDEWVGVGAVALVLFYPMVFATSRSLLVDFPLTAMVALGASAILAADAGIHPRRGWWLGLAVGLALLTKWTAVVFLLVPWAFWFGRCVHRDKPRWTVVVGRLLMALAVAVVVAAPWYVTVFEQFLKTAREATGGSFPQRENDPTALLASLEWYWSAAEVALLLKPLLWLTAAGVVAFFVRRRAWSGAIFLLCWIVPAFVFFVLLPNKDGRYLMPLLPALALLAAAGFRSVPWRAVRALVWSAIVAIGLFQFYAISFAWPFTVPHFYTGVPQRQDWKIAEVVNSLAKLRPSDWIYIGVLPDHPDFEANIFVLEATVHDAQLHFSGFGQFRDTMESLGNFTAVVSKTGVIAATHTVAARSVMRDDIRDWVKAGKHDPYIELANTWPLPDGSQAEVYRIYAEPKVPDPPIGR